MIFLQSLGIFLQSEILQPFAQKVRMYRQKCVHNCLRNSMATYSYCLSVHISFGFLLRLLLVTSRFCA